VVGLRGREIASREEQERQTIKKPALSIDKFSSREREREREREAGRRLECADWWDGWGPIIDGLT